jgi:hypothetical protein
LNAIAMLKPLPIVSLERRLDHAITKFDEQSDIYLQSHIARYLIIVTAGYFEQVVQSVLQDFAKPRGSPEIVNYVEATLAWEGSINRAKLSRILDRFDPGWFPKIEAVANDAQKNAVDSVKDLRDQLAHGAENGTGYGVAKTYHVGVRGYAAHLVTVLP